MKTQFFALAFFRGDKIRDRVLNPKHLMLLFVWNRRHQIAAFYESQLKAIHSNGRNELGEQVASGLYFYHLSAEDYSATRKMLILK